MTLGIKLSNKICVPVAAIFHFSGVSFSSLCDKSLNLFFFFKSPKLKLRIVHHWCKKGGERAKWEVLKDVLAGKLELQYNRD